VGHVRQRVKGKEGIGVGLLGREVQRTGSAGLNR
jgi:hypothetical protein